MDKDSFWQEVIAMAKRHKQNSHTVEQLPEEQMAQLESNVYAHIDHLFSESEVTPTATNANVTTESHSQHRGSPKQSNSLWAWLFQESRKPVLVLSMLALFSVGVLGYLFSDSRISEPRFDIPQSVVAADVHRYILIPQQGSRALAGTLLSERRRAFLTGVTQADLDLIGDIKSLEARQIALWYHNTTTNTQAVDAVNAMKTVQSSVARYSGNDQTNFWFKHGYAVEMVHLAAKQSMDNLNASALIDALQFYRVHASMPVPDKTEPDNPELNSSNADIARQYINNHQKLVLATPAELPAPEQVQEIVDITHDMKVLIQ